MAAPLPLETRKKVEELYRTGKYSSAQISRLTGVGAAQIRNWAMRYKWQKNETPDAVELEVIPPSTFSEVAAAQAQTGHTIVNRAVLDITRELENELRVQLPENSATVMFPNSDDLNLQRDKRRKSTTLDSGGVTITLRQTGKQLVSQLLDTRAILLNKSAHLSSLAVAIVERAQEEFMSLPTVQEMVDQHMLPPDGVTVMQAAAVRNKCLLDLAASLQKCASDSLKLAGVVPALKNEIASEMRSFAKRFDELYAKPDNDNAQSES
jgi:hypothetical protein